MWTRIISILCISLLLWSCAPSADQDAFDHFRNAQSDRGQLVCTQLWFWSVAVVGGMFEAKGEGSVNSALLARAARAGTLVLEDGGYELSELIGPKTHILDDTLLQIRTQIIDTMPSFPPEMSPEQVQEEYTEHIKRNLSRVNGNHPLTFEQVDAFARIATGNGETLTDVHLTAIRDAYEAALRESGEVAAAELLSSAKLNRAVAEELKERFIKPGEVHGMVPVLMQKFSSVMRSVWRFITRQGDDVAEEVSEEMALAQPGRAQRIWTGIRNFPSFTWSLIVDALVYKAVEIASWNFVHKIIQRGIFGAATNPSNLFEATNYTFHFGNLIIAQLSEKIGGGRTCPPDGVENDPRSANGNFLVDTICSGFGEVEWKISPNEVQKTLALYSIGFWSNQSSHQTIPVQILVQAPLEDSVWTGTVNEAAVALGASQDIPWQAILAPFGPDSTGTGAYYVDRNSEQSTWRNYSLGACTADPSLSQTDPTECERSKHDIKLRTSDSHPGVFFIDHAFENEMVRFSNQNKPMTCSTLDGSTLTQSNSH